MISSNIGLNPRRRGSVKGDLILKKKRNGVDVSVVIAFFQLPLAGGADAKERFSIERTSSHDRPFSKQETFSKNILICF